MAMPFRAFGRRFERRWLRPLLRRCRGIVGLSAATKAADPLPGNLELRLDAIEGLLRELVGLHHLAAAEAAEINRPQSDPPLWTAGREAVGR